MANNILVTRREYTNQFRAEKTSWLLGNVGDIISLEIDVEIEIQTVSSQQSILNSNNTSTVKEFTTTVGDFQADGFSTGGLISWNTTLKIGSGSTPVIYSGTGTIDILNSSFMRITVVSGTFPPTFGYPQINGNDESTPLKIFSADKIDGLIFNYNFISNSDLQSNSLNSLIDSSIPTLKAVGLDPSVTTLIPLTPLSFKSGISIISANIKGGGFIAPLQKFTIILEYQIMPLFEDFSDFQNLTAPSFLFGVESLTDVFNFKFLPQIGNPNISISANSTQIAQFGNVGWFNENYDGNNSLYSKIGISYFNAVGSVVDSIQKDELTSFSLQINQPLNSPTSKYKIGFAFVPNDKTILENNYYYNFENILYNGLGILPLNQSSTPALFTGSENGFGARMDIQFNSINSSGNTVTINGQFQPNILFSDYFDSLNIDEWNYIIWVSCANENLATSISDRVSVIIDQNQFIEKPVSFVSADVVTDFLNHAQGVVNVGTFNYLGSLEDEVLSQSLMFLDTAKNEKLNEVSFLIEGFNIVTNESFIAENYNVNTSVFPLNGLGVQQINFKTTRGFQMASGVNKNIIELVRDSTKDVGTKKAYFFRYSFRYRWEDWILNNSVPNILIDGTKKNDGQNQDWARLSNFDLNWKFRFSVQTKLNSNSIDLNTKNNSNIYINTYEDSTVWNGEITHFDETSTTNLFVGLDSNGIRQNAILDNSKTLIQADFDLKNVGGDVGNILDYYGVIRIEKYQNGGINGIEMLSSVLTNVNGILKPIVGETFCKVEKISLTKIRLTGLIDESFLDVSSTYKTSARIGYSNLSVLGIYGKQYGQQYD